MTRECRRIELNDSAGPYIEGYLEHSTSLLRLVLRRHDLAEGTVVTWLPVDLDIDHERLHQFRWSIHPPQPLTEETLRYDAAGNRVHVVATEMLDDLLVPVIEAHLETGPDRVCIFEVGLRWSNSTGFGPVGETRVLRHDDEGYFLLTADDAGHPEHILETIEMARFPLQIAGVLTSTPPGVDIPSDKSTFTTAEVERLASQTIAIVVGAYDEEGFLVWWRGR